MNSFRLRILSLTVKLVFFFFTSYVNETAAVATPRNGGRACKLSTAFENHPVDWLKFRGPLGFECHFKCQCWRGITGIGNCTLWWVKAGGSDSQLWVVEQTLWLHNPHCATCHVSGATNKEANFTGRAKGIFAWCSGGTYELTCMVVYVHN